jgi:predicted RNase H-like nuclease (RuvC/YqgF family)
MSTVPAAVPEVNPEPEGPSYTVRVTLPKGGTIRTLEAALKQLLPRAAFDVEKDEVPSSRCDRLSAAIADAQSEVEELKQELESWKENLPENLQDGQKAQELDAAIEQLDEVISALDEASASADSVEFPGMF